MALNSSIATSLASKCHKMLGLNRAIGYGVMSKLWAALATPVTMVIIANRFSKEQQGYYYTFASLLAMQLFFELGLTTVISQFTSHEFIHLKWLNRGSIEGAEVPLNRVLGLLIKSMLWFAVAALLLVAVVLPTGIIFFSKSPGVIHFSWHLPWIMAVCGIAANLLLVPLYAVVLGSGDVAFSYKREMLANIFGTILGWLVILAGGGLYAVSVTALGNFITSLLFLVIYRPDLFSQLRGNWRNIPVRNSISWRREIWPLQLKTALSWISGYFIFQLFVPVLFYFHGSIVAGQMGMTLAMANGLFGIGLIWLSSSAPQFGKLVALKAWAELDALFHAVIRRSILVVATGALAGGGLIYIIQQLLPVGQRFIPAYQALVLFLSIVIQIWINGYAIYLRAHKQEPFAKIMLMWACIQTVITWQTGKHLASMGVVFGYFAVSLFIILPATYWLWKKTIIEWHQF